MPETVAEVSVFYFVVFPDGRRVTVDLDSLRRNAASWASEGLRFVTLVNTLPAPVYGTIERTP